MSAGYRAGRSAEVAEDGVGELRPQRGGPFPEALRTEERGGQSGGGVDPEEAARLAEVPEGGRGVAAARPVRGLAPTDLEAEPPVVRVLAAEAGEHPRQPGELDGGGLGEEVAVEHRRGEELARSEERR